jgi:hypothetical protein
MAGNKASPPNYAHKKKKRNKERKGAEAPPTPSSLKMAGNKASPPNYAHKNKKVKNEESNLPPFIQEVYEGMH